jgi:hypothetical protein
MRKFYQPDLAANFDNPFVRDGARYGDDERYRRKPDERREASAPD